MHKYNDAKHMNIRPKVAVIIASYIGNPHGSGVYIPNENKLETLKVNLAAHKHFKAGVDYDLIVVNCGSTNPEGIEFLNSINALDRENEGYSFGAWKWAWEQLKNEGYTFFCFCEDDLAPSKDRWLTDLIHKFFSKPGIGAVGSTVEEHSALVHEFTAMMCKICERDVIFNLDGNFTFTSAEVLRQVDKIGGLKVIKTGTDHDKGVMNELFFQQQILELGYSIVGFNDKKHLVVHGSELRSNELACRGKIPVPLINVNGRINVPEVKEIFSFYE